MKAVKIDIKLVKKVDDVFQDLLYCSCATSGTRPSDPEYTILTCVCAFLVTKIFSSVEVPADGSPQHSKRF